MSNLKFGHFILFACRGVTLNGRGRMRRSAFRLVLSDSLQKSRSSVVGALVIVVVVVIFLLIFVSPVLITRHSI